MRIITWNCNGKFHESFKEIIKEKADVYVIQECGNPSESKPKNIGNLLLTIFGLEWISIGV